MPPGRPSEGRWWATELLLSLELAALTALAFSRPVLDTDLLPTWRTCSARRTVEALAPRRVGSGPAQRFAALP